MIFFSHSSRIRILQLKPYFSSSPEKGGVERLIERGGLFERGGSMEDLWYSPNKNKNIYLLTYFHFFQ